MAIVKKPTAAYRVRFAGGKDVLIHAPNLLNAATRAATVANTTGTTVVSVTLKAK